MRWLGTAAGVGLRLLSANLGTSYINGSGMASMSAHMRLHPSLSRLASVDTSAKHDISPELLHSLSGSSQEQLDLADELRIRVGSVKADAGCQLRTSNLHNSITCSVVVLRRELPEVCASVVLWRTLGMPNLLLPHVDFRIGVLEVAATGLQAVEASDRILGIPSHLTRLCWRRSVSFARLEGL